MSLPARFDLPTVCTLRECEERFKAFMDHSPAVAWMKDEAGRYVYVSRRYEELVGGGGGDWLGRTDADVWPPETARQFRENDQAVLAGRRVVETLETVARPDGTALVWWVFKFPFTDAQRLRYVGGVGVDVTERERAKADLQKANADLRAALDKVRKLESLVTMCAWTKQFKLGDRWVTVEEYLRERHGVRVTHGISEEALTDVMRELEQLTPSNGSAEQP